MDQPMTTDGTTQPDPDGTGTGVPNLPAELYLITCDGEWPVTAAVCQEHAIGDARRRWSNTSGRVRITRVRVEVLERLGIQTEVVRETLVPEGTAVNR